MQEKKYNNLRIINFKSNHPHVQAYIGDDPLPFENVSDDIEVLDDFYKLLTSRHHITIQHDPIEGFTIIVASKDGHGNKEVIGKNSSHDFVVAAKTACKQWHNKYNNKWNNFATYLACENEFQEFLKDKRDAANENQEEQECDIKEKH